jgi:hypothetical protein
VTAPVLGPLSCTVLIDGVRVADGSPTDDPAAAMVLDGLRVTWGRGTTLDQPEPATCTATLLGGQDTFLGVLGTGRRLDVRTDTTIYPDPTVPTVTDPGFDVAGPGRILDNAALTVGGGVATLTPGPAAARRARVIFGPALFVPAGTDPAAWDTIPKTAAGQTWAYGATVTLPVGLGPAMTGQLHPVAFTGPWASTARVLPDTIALPLGAAGPRSVVFTPPPGVWLGLALDVHPAGPTWDTSTPGTTWDSTEPTLTWDALAQVRIDDLLVLAPAAGTTRSAVVFGGRITDLAAVRSGDASRMQVTAQDHTAELANRDIADTPWPAQTLGTRAQRIVTLSGQPTTLTVDPGAAAVTVTRDDADNRAALGELQALATTADGVLWSAVHALTGQYLWIEDTHTRPALLLITKQGGVVVIVPDPDPDAATALSACDVLLDPLTWVQDVADVATRVAVTWKEQTTAPAELIDHTETVTDTALVTRLGVRRIGVTSHLTTSAAAAKLAAAVLGRTADLGWRITDLTWSTGLTALDPDQVDAAFTLLDGTTRLGAPLVLTELPAWAPADGGVLPLFTEGGQYTYTDGHWVLDLVVSTARAQGTSPAWQDLPADWLWNQFDPGISWTDMSGVHPV